MSPRTLVVVPDTNNINFLEIYEEYPDEVEKVAPTNNILMCIFNAVSSFAKNIGVDLRLRLKANPSKVHFFSQSSFANVFKDENLSSSCTGFFRGYDKEIYVVSPDNLPCITAFTRTQHELLHTISYMAMQVDSGGYVRSYSQYGYESIEKGYGKVINESLTELTNVYIRKFLWQSYEPIKKWAIIPSEGFSVYLQFGIALLDMIIEYIKCRTNRSYMDILSELQFHMIVDPANGWRFLADQLGKQRVAYLMHLDVENFRDKYVSYSDLEHDILSLGLQKEAASYEANPGFRFLDNLAFE